MTISEVVSLFMLFFAAGSFIISLIALIVQIIIFMQKK